MFFKDYKHIELLEDDITISSNRTDGKKIKGVKNWKPTNPFRLRVKATVVKNGKRKIKKRTFLYENMYMVDALKKAQAEHRLLIDEIKAERFSPATTAPTDKDEMYTFGRAFYRSLDSRKAEAEAENETFRTYDQVKAFYDNHLKAYLEHLLLDQISPDTLNTIRANMKHEDGTPYSKRTKLSVLQQVNPVYTWFNEYSNLSVKTPAKIKKGTLKKLNNKRIVNVTDIKPLFVAMANYTYKKYPNSKYSPELSEPFKNIFVWLLHGRRVNEVLSLRWEHINLDNGTYTIKAENNKAGIDMTYKLTPYQIDVLPEAKKEGLVYPSLRDKNKQMVQVTLSNHWHKVRKAVGTWELNNRHNTPSSELHIHDIRHLIATEMLNKYHIVDEISGAVLGHTRSGVTSVYAQMLAESVDNAIMKVLDGVLK